MQRVDSLEKTLMLGGIGGRRQKNGSNSPGKPARPARPPPTARSPVFPLLLSGRSVHVLGGGRRDDTGFFDSKLIHLAGGTATFHEDRLCEQPVSCPFPHTTLSRGAAAVTLYSSHESKSLRHVQLLATPWTKQPMDSPGQNTRVGEGMMFMESLWHI